MIFTQTEIQDLLKNKIQDAEKRFGKSFKTILLEILSLERIMSQSYFVQDDYGYAPKAPEQPEIIPEEESNDEVIELSKWNDYYSYPTVGALRQYAFKKEENGFDSVLEYGGAKGGRLLINVRKFKEWQKNRKKK